MSRSRRCLDGRARDIWWRRGADLAVKTTRSAGMLLLALWLILTGVQGPFSLPIPGVIRTVTALLAGVLILIGV